MKASMTKAILLSALVFPGAGQLYLKRFKTGVILLVVVVICFFTMVATIMNTAMSAVQQIQIQGGIVDMSQITRIATETTEQTGNTGYSLSLSLIVICWLYSIIDAYLGSKKTSASVK